MIAKGAKALRLHIDGGQLVVAPGVYDALTARIVEMQGAPAVYLPGHAVGVHLGCGQPMTTMTEAINVAQRVSSAVEVPVIMDAGAGFGDPAHVHRLVRECVRAGVAAIHIEDQTYPKRPAYHRGVGRIESVETTVAKLKAATNARGDSDLLIFARTDALRVTGSLEEAVTRANAFARAGADGLVVLDLSPEQLGGVRNRLPDVPLFWIGAVKDSGPPLSRIHNSGFTGALFPFNTLGAVCDSVQRTWEKLFSDGQLNQKPEMLATALQTSLDVTRMSDYWEIETRYATSSADGMEK